MNNQRAIDKILSRNDLAETGTHQAGILIPKTGEVREFFPQLELDEVNPRVIIYFEDIAGQQWKFNFIYYNNKFRGGTRNEFRLTGMTSFFRSNNLKAGDKIILMRTGENFSISYERMHKTEPFESGGIVKLVLGDKWRIINI